MSFGETFPRAVVFAWARGFGFGVGVAFGGSAFRAAVLVLVLVFDFGAGAALVPGFFGARSTVELGLSRPVFAAGFFRGDFFATALPRALDAMTQR
jgi:hypothetical protein